MKSKNTKSNDDLDDDNIPNVDLPQSKNSTKSVSSVQPLPESTRPRQDGPGGN
ncbi:hypothetical protein [Konateibacter massiliensis]|uniref:hypothetical protein n=1 Tax=Konateibacter massiliensis TaxID=2002841 RepID=UPI0015D4EF31|nr:hypothetical protein [Konateibacter massiliensis]